MGHEASGQQTATVQRWTDQFAGKFPAAAAPTVGVPYCFNAFAAATQVDNQWITCVWDRRLRKYPKFAAVQHNILCLRFSPLDRIRGWWDPVKYEVFFLTYCFL